jgi:hypothetical protein
VVGAAPRDQWHHSPRRHRDCDEGPVEILITLVTILLKTIVVFVVVVIACATFLGSAAKVPEKLRTAG